MTERLSEILNRRFREKDPAKPWVYWHRYFDWKEKVAKGGRYQDRRRITKTLGKKAGVRYFRFHAFRHEGASSMDNSNVPISAIQRLLGHENRSTTEIYLHSLGDTEREAIHTLERVRAFSHTESHTGKKRG